MTKQQEIQERLAKLQSNLAGIPGQIVALEQEAEALRSNMAEELLQGDLGDAREQLRLIDQQIADFRQDELLYEKSIQSEEAELAAVVKHSWRTKDGMVAANLEKLEQKLYEQLEPMVETMEEIYRLSADRHDLAIENGIDPSTVQGWNTYRSKLGGLFALVGRRFRIDMDRSPSGEARSWLASFRPDPLKRAA